MWAPWLQVGVWLLVGLVAGLVVLATVLIWRDGFVRGWHGARDTPPTCPRCGYNLSGLTHCRCPECGTEYELDVLWKNPLFSRRLRPKRRDRTEKAVSEQKCE